MRAGAPLRRCNTICHPASRQRSNGRSGSSALSRPTTWLPTAAETLVGRKVEPPPAAGIGEGMRPSSDMSSLCQCTFPALAASEVSRSFCQAAMSANWSGGSPFSLPRPSPCRYERASSRHRRLRLSASAHRAGRVSRTRCSRSVSATRVASSTGPRARSSGLLRGAKQAHHLALLLRRRQMPKIDLPEATELLIDQLHRQEEPTHPGEGGAQDLVARHHAAQSSGEPARIQRSCEAPGRLLAERLSPQLFAETP